MNEKKFIDLIRKYQEGNLNSEKKKILDEWLLSLDKEMEEVTWEGHEKNKLWNLILNKIDERKYAQQNRDIEIIKTIKYLYNKFDNNQASKHDMNQLVKLLDENKDNKSVLKLLGNTWNTIAQNVFADQMKKESSSIFLRSALHSNKNWSWRTKFAAAATIILLISTGAWFFIARNVNNNDVNLPLRYKNDVMPGGNKAILTLADGKSITLDDAGKGILAKQGETNIFKEDKGKLVYQVTNEKSKEIVYNTLTTPRGGQYHLVLPDGSQVWLNSASSIVYPTQFDKKERLVKITGEAYFEVASATISSLGKSKRVPFIVDVDDFKVRVLGTQFNIMAYNDETNSKTTLIEGKVEIIKDEKTKSIEPGQQAVLDNNFNNIRIIENADVEEAIAWKNGYFHFSHANLETVLRSLSRWYDVEIIYEGECPELKFGGELQRDLSLSQVLLILEKSNVLFKIEGNKLIVINNK